MPKIIDTADNVTKKLDALKAEGVHTVIRYDDRLPSRAWKQIFLAEAKAFKDKGMRLGIVYEGAGATPSSFSEQSGYLDAVYSRQQAAQRGQPDNSAVYFAVDFDPSESQIQGRILPYFNGVYRAFSEDNNLPKLRVGAYCSGLCATMLKKEHPDILIWITCSLGFAGSRGYVRAGKQDLFQNKCDTSLLGVDCDFDEANTADWGSFVPWGESPSPTVPSPPAPINHDIKWLQAVLQKYGYSGQIDGSAGPLTIAAMIRYAEHFEVS